MLESPPPPPGKMRPQFSPALYDPTAPVPPILHTLSCGFKGMAEVLSCPFPRCGVLGSVSFLDLPPLAGPAKSFAFRHF